MIQLLVICLLLQTVYSSEVYCVKGSTKVWNVVEQLMNDEDATDNEKLTFGSISTTELDAAIALNDIVIVRTIRIDLKTKKGTRFLSFLQGAETIERFMSKGGYCKKEYTKGITEIEYSGRGEINEIEAMKQCGYREMICGDERYVLASKEQDYWCRYSLHHEKWNTYFTHINKDDNHIKVYDDELICELDENSRNNHTVLCLKKNCSFSKKGDVGELSTTDIQSVCNEEKKIKRRMYTYRQTASQWGDEAFKHFIRNYIVTFFFYCYFMLQARRMPMIRKEKCIAWKKFIDAINPKDDEDNGVVDITKKREKYVYERYKREAKVAKVRIDHLQEELKEAKQGIAKQSKLAKESEEGGESASNRPHNISVDTRIVKKEPCSPSELAALIQWSWMLESHMVKCMNEDDNAAELRKMYGLEGTKKIEKMIGVEEKK